LVVKKKTREESPKKGKEWRGGHNSWQKNMAEKRDNVKQQVEKEMGKYSTLSV